MKKRRFLLPAILFAFIALMATSCLKNDVPTPKQPQDPALEKADIDAFIAAKGFNMIEDTAATGLMYQMINIGDTANGRLTNDKPIAVLRYTASLLNDSIFHQTAVDTTEKIDLSRVSLIPSFYHYLLMLGKGGSVQFVTPSKYAYGAYDITGENDKIVIPANSPLYFKIELVDVISGN